MNKFICIAGMTGSGKTIVSDYFVNKGYSFVRFGQIVLDEVKKRKIAPTEANERKVREEIRKKHGMAAMAILNYPKFVTLLKKGPVVADGLYSWSEYKYLKKKFGKNMKVVAVFSPPKLRYERLANRLTGKKDKKLRMRPLSPQDAERRDFAEIENIEKGGPIAMADYTLLNTKDSVFLQKQIEELEIDLKKNVS